jgi:predicted O-methyltransferase YrrM
MYKKQTRHFKGKNRKLHYCEKYNVVKRSRTFDGLRCLPRSWGCLQNFLDLNGPLNCVEIGSHEGQSATYFLKEVLKHKDSKLTCVDPWIKSHWLKRDPTGLCYEDIFDLNMELNDKDKQVKKFSGLNSDYYKTKEFKKQVFDIAYIDDIHTYESTCLNIKELYPRIIEGGIMIFDDYDFENYSEMWADTPSAGVQCTEPVKKAVDEFLEREKDNVEIIFQEYQIIIRKKHDWTIVDND